MAANRSRIIRPLALATALAAAGAQAQVPERQVPQDLAPGFTVRAAGSRLVVLPPDMELFSISAGGVEEPRADWTAAAQKNFGLALAHEGPVLGDRVTTMDPAQADAFAPITNLHRAVASAIVLHHVSGGLELPTKGARLDWSLGDAVRPLREATGADYALFTWIRDSYASGQRKATMLALALLGAISVGGEQVGYASLVDLRSGRVVWFKRLDRMSGDLREPETAKETVETLLKGFPGLQ